MKKSYTIFMTRILALYTCAVFLCTNAVTISQTPASNKNVFQKLFKRKIVEPNELNNNALNKTHKAVIIGAKRTPLQTAPLSKDLLHAKLSIKDPTKKLLLIIASEPTKSRLILQQKNGILEAFSFQDKEHLNNVKNWLSLTLSYNNNIFIYKEEQLFADKIGQALNAKRTNYEIQLIYNPDKGSTLAIRTPDKKNIFVASAIEADKAEALVFWLKYKKQENPELKNRIIIEEK